MSVWIEVNGYDEEYREFGDCGVMIIENNGKIAKLHTCSLEEGHEGLHDWDPDYVYPEDEDV